MGGAFLLMWQFGQGSAIGFMRLKVVNDTKHVVKIQPCWDLRCWDIHGLDPTVVPAGKARRVESKWEDDISHPISVAVLRPHAEFPKWEGCLVNVFPPHKRVGVFWVSSVTTCPTSSGGGGGGG
jgi:hypothetical protein